MPEDITRQSVLFPNLFRRPVVAKFDQPHGSCDGGAILLKACDERLGLTQRLTSCVVDARQPGKVEHTIGDLVRQRLYAIACGYPDGNDAARLATDPIQKLLIGRDPISGAALASQPTLSRFENAVRRADLYRMGEALAECVIERHRRRLGRRVRHITIDLEVVRHEGRHPKNNPRFVVTNLTGWPRKLYERVYCGRGEVENRIKELHHGLEIDRTSCSSFLANQLRVLLTAAAYVLMQELRPRRVCTRSGQHPARSPAQARRVGRALGASYRVAYATDICISH